MLDSFVKLRQTLTSRADSEHVQAVLRILAGVACGLYVLAIHRYAPTAGAFSLFAQLTVALTIIVAGACFLLHIVCYPHTNHARRWIGIVFDVTMAGLSILSLGESGAPVFGMYIWIVIGNGFRYGLSYLYGSAALALVSFYTVAYFSPYYRSNYGLLGLGTFLLAVVIPVYLGSLLKALQRNLEAAREADRTKTRFLANVSHDLRTPLNVMMANCEVLARDLRANSGLSPQLRDMQEAAATLNNLVSDLLDVAKLEAGRIIIRSEPFNLAELLGRIVRFNELAARNNSTLIYLTLDADTPVRVRGDEIRLEQVLNNIVSNAVKFTEHGDIHIHAKPDMRGHGSGCAGAIVSISDTGIGMEPTAMGRIFSRFEQADISYARSRCGAGLGLSIATELTNLMGGSIAVESAAGKGSCFSVSVPLSLDDEPEDERPVGYQQEQLSVVCHRETDRQHWASIFDGRSLPPARVFSAQDVAAGGPPPGDKLYAPACVLVDAEDLEMSPAELPGLARRFCCTSDTSFILLNAPREHTEHGSLREYRCVSAGATAGDIKRCLDITYWSTSSSQIQTGDGDNLQGYARTLRNRSVLVADDNELNRRVISSMLNGLNARIVEARDGQEALDKLAAQHIDIALLDVQMPELSGIDVMRAAAERFGLNATPLIALTADTTDECHSRCLAAGAAAVLHKPVSMRPLYRALHRAVTNAHPAQEQLPTCNPPSRHPSGEIDYALLQELAQSAQHPDYLASLATCFKTEGGQLLEELRSALRAEDLDNSRALLHRLKGMSGTIGANPIATLCHDKLAIPDIQLRASATALTEQLFRLHQETAEALEHFLSGISPATP